VEIVCLVGVFGREVWGDEGFDRTLRFVCLGGLTSSTGFFVVDKLFERDLVGLDGAGEGEGEDPDKEFVDMEDISDREEKMLTRRMGLV